MTREQYIKRLIKIQEENFFTDTYLMKQLHLAWTTINTLRSGKSVSRATMRKIKMWVDAYEEGKIDVSN